MTTSFEQLLNVYWLRPETALWRELDIRAMHQFKFTSPSLDLGCGDGMFSFIRAGGAVSNQFDAFRSVANLDKFFENVDIYDAYEKNEQSIVVEPPGYQIDVAFDYKENLLKKAMQLNIYIESKVGDANRPLPFPDESFNSIFSNIVYWLDDPQSVLKEISRILRPGGRVCLMLPNQSLPEFSFYNQLHVKSGDPKWEFLQRLDRGRFTDNIRQAKSRHEWEAHLGNADLNIVGHVTHLSKLVIQIWDIGLRPLFPVLKKMTDQLPPENYLDIKSEWCDTIRHFLEPVLELDNDLNGASEPAFHCYIVEK